MKKIISDMNWLWAATAITMLYVVSLGWLIGNQRLSLFLAGNDLNEVGDFIAGVFSPLAFIWLVAAVLTQRQELNETREQFEQNQKVVDAQMQTIKEQNALLAIQQEQSEESAIRTYKLNLFDKRFEIYNELIALREDMEQGIRVSEWQRLTKITEKSEFVFGSAVSEYLAGVVAACIELLDFEEEHSNSWYIDPVEGGDMPINAEDVAIRAKAITMQLLVLNLMSVQALKIVMISSMRVSDE